MRPMREYPPAPKYTPGDDPDERWHNRTCAGHNAWMWDYDIHGESTEARKQRHRDAIAGCHDCPALDLCMAQKFEGAAGVIAGKVVVGP